MRDDHGAQRRVSREMATASRSPSLVRQRVVLHATSRLDKEDTRFESVCQLPGLQFVPQSQSYPRGKQPVKPKVINNCEHGVRHRPQPNYMFLRLDNFMIQNDVQRHANLHNTAPAGPISVTAGGCLRRYVHAFRGDSQAINLFSFSMITNVGG
ncbi:uncharacterized protein B0I36DRAFT_55533 [Microdochium trichocladiopsis]|uniref:Uncharacterized protein n=1 Tax=Microdochium trichocladiopsis TaxID=1682393 RepID=A0A9P9BHH2_9PEZI|nr:uncharacterized protein B0I36DRAFT_55533 [Microdochium trichocladiopsis]KAH7010772.1 hypothetical protein B0I36DRAFT_55533 [Microdochium trichocladiopsis]